MNKAKIVVFYMVLLTIAGAFGCTTDEDPYAPMVLPDVEVKVGTRFWPCPKQHPFMGSMGTDTLYPTWAIAHAEYSFGAKEDCGMPAPIGDDRPMRVQKIHDGYARVQYLPKQMQEGPGLTGDLPACPYGKTFMLSVSHIQDVLELEAAEAQEVARTKERAKQRAEEDRQADIRAKAALAELSKP